MSIDYSACSADVITVYDLKKICPIAFGVFKKALIDEGIDDEEFYRSLCDGDINENVNQAYQALCMDFERVTEGLTLELGYHDRENDGCRGDDVDGTFWEVGGVWKLSPAAKKLKERGIVIERAAWVCSG